MQPTNASNQGIAGAKQGSGGGSMEGGIESVWLADAADTAALGQRLARELAGAGPGAPCGPDWDGASQEEPPGSGQPGGEPGPAPFQPQILLLSGGLGAGKTCLVQGLAAALGISEAITSPTFALAQHYQGQGSAGPTALVHLDLYRLELAAAADDLFAQEEEEAAALGALLAVEWPERLGFWPQGAWQVELQLEGEGRLALIRRPQLGPPEGPPGPGAQAGPQ
jgi:tRNA threonylcarbamoyladenosine biosynthesis protein TsaE